MEQAVPQPRPWRQRMRSAPGGWCTRRLAQLSTQPRRRPSYCGDAGAMRECLALRHHTSGLPASQGCAPERSRQRGTLEMTSGEETNGTDEGPSWAGPGTQQWGRCSSAQGSAQCVVRYSFQQDWEGDGSGCSGDSTGAGTSPTWARPDRLLLRSASTLTLTFLGLPGVFLIGPKLQFT